MRISLISFLMCIALFTSFAVFVSLTPTQNKPPHARFTIHGTTKSDIVLVSTSCCNVTKTNWKQIKGVPTVLLHADSAFCPVTFKQAGIYSYQLTVTGANKLTSSDTVNVIIQ